MAAVFLGGIVPSWCVPTEPGSCFAAWIRTPWGHLLGDRYIMRGHCVVALGVSVTRQEFLIANSWGPAWSAVRWGTATLKGHAKLSYPAMARLLDEDGEACVPTRSKV